MKYVIVIVVSFILTACSSHKQPPQADSSNLHPINDENAINIIKERVNK